MEHTEILDTMSRLAAAWDAQDPDAFAALYTDDGGIITTTAHSKGRDEIREFMTMGFAGPIKGTTFAEEFERIRYVTPDLAIVNGIGGFTHPGEDAVRPDLVRRSSWVLVRTPDGWRVEQFHNCPIGG